MKPVEAPNFTTAAVHLFGTSPLSQSRQHDDPKLGDKESPAAYDQRTWRSKLNVAEVNGKRTVVIPEHGMHQCIAAAARYSKRQIPGQGKATWTAKFVGGISIAEVIPLNISPDDVASITISANADGIRGSGKRVPRTFPQIAPGWNAKFTVWILDEIITEDIFTEILEMAGMFIGIGRFRPEKGGGNGRFIVRSVNWTDRRKLRAA